ncbi:MAG: YfhO family protein [Pseudomonadota bacterium]|nr:YfhO family protein [Pseudomonadota bacterium]
MTGSMQAHYFNPLFWVLALVPEHLMLHGVALIHAACTFATVSFSFAIARHFRLSKVSSVLVATVAGLGWFNWFTFTAFIAVPMYAGAMAAIWFLLTHQRRAWASQTALLAVCLFFIFINPHPSYVAGFGMPCLAVAIFVLFSDRDNGNRGTFLLTTTLAGMLAFGLAFYRIYPVFTTLVLDHSALSLFRVAISDGVHEQNLLTLFNPLALGSTIGESFHINRMFGANRHIQIHSALYFGLIPCLLILTATLNQKRTMALLFLLSAFVIALLGNTQAWALGTYLIKLFFTPFSHDGSFRVQSNFFFLATLIAALRLFDDRHIEFRAGLSKIIVLLWAVITLAHLPIYTELASLARTPIFADIIPQTLRKMRDSYGLELLLVKVLPLTVIGLTVWALIRIRFLERRSIAAWIVVSSLVLGLMLIVVPGITTEGNFFLFRLPSSNLPNYMMLDLLAFGLACLVFLYFEDKDLGKLSQKSKILGVASIIVIFGIVTVRFSSQLQFQNSFINTFYTPAGLLKMTLLFVIVLHVVQRYRLGQGVAFSRIIMGLTLLTIVDLAGAHRTYSYSNADAPYPRRFNEIYPSEKIDFLHANLLKQKAVSTTGASNGLPVFKPVSKDWAFAGKEVSICSIGPGSPTHMPATVTFCHDGSTQRRENVYFDADLSNDAKIGYFGAFIKGSGKEPVHLMVSSPSVGKGTAAIHVPTDGRWHWVKSYIDTGKFGQSIRVHLNLGSNNLVKIASPILSSRPEYVIARAKEFVKTKGPLANIAFGPSIKFEKDQFRFNFVTTFLHHTGNELFTNWNMLHGIRTYSGIDSIWSEEYKSFIKAFDPGYKIEHGGILSNVRDKRLLELLGVKYSLGDNNRLEIIHNALPRLATFTNAHSVSSFNHALALLKSPNYPIRSTILLTGNTPSASVDGSKNLQPLNFQIENADHIVTSIAKNSGRYVFFGDRYSPDWKARFNGRALPILRANAIFMGVKLPPGEGKLELLFSPAEVVTGLKLSYIALSVFGVIILMSLVRIIVARKRHMVAPSQ